MANRSLFLLLLALVAGATANPASAAGWEHLRGKTLLITANDKLDQWLSDRQIGGHVCVSKFNLYFSEEGRLFNFAQSSECARPQGTAGSDSYQGDPRFGRVFDLKAGSGELPHFRRYTVEAEDDRIVISISYTPEAPFGTQGSGKIVIGTGDSCSYTADERDFSLLPNQDMQQLKLLSYVRSTACEVVEGRVQGEVTNLPDPRRSNVPDDLRDK